MKTLNYRLIDTAILLFSYPFHRSFLTICCGLFLLSQPAYAVEFKPEAYDIYIGDLNGDSKKDFYFQGKELIIASILVKPINYVIYREGSGYTPAAVYSLSSSLLTSYVTQGILRKAVLSNTALGNSTDALYWADSLNGFTSVLVRGADTYEPSFMLATYVNIDLPLILNIFNPANPDIPNFSNKNIVFSLTDVNADGRRDLVTGTQAVLTNFNGMLREKTYNLQLTTSSAIVESFYYDDLGRLIRTESTDGVTQEFSLDAENNRTSSSQLKGLHN